MQFYITDVFAEEKYQGNPLSVFFPPPEKNLLPETMQKIAREINFSETTFVFKHNDAYHVRIFTPDTEIPCAGHPVIGTAFIINKILHDDQLDHVYLNLAAGNIRVNFIVDKNSGENHIEMQQLSPEFLKTFAKENIAEILQIDPNDFHPDYPIEAITTGLPAVIIPLKNLEAVKKCIINHQAFKEFITHHFKANILVFTKETIYKNNHLHVRVFMDDPGFLEDPATGSANANLAAYLLKYNFFKTQKLQLNSEQGYCIGRPSLIKIHAEKINDAYKISIGGKAFLIAKGEWL